MKKRIVLRRKLVHLNAPAYLYRDEMPRVQYIFHAYRIRCAEWHMGQHMGSSVTELEAGYCLDSSVDTEMRSLAFVDVGRADFGTMFYSEMFKQPKLRMDPTEIDAAADVRHDPALAFVGGSRSTRPRDPNYRPGSFGGLGRFRRGF